jgi:hypothetical protein
MIEHRLERLAGRGQASRTALEMATHGTEGGVEEARHIARGVDHHADRIRARGQDRHLEEVTSGGHGLPTWLRALGLASRSGRAHSPAPMRSVPPGRRARDRAPLARSARSVGAAARGQPASIAPRSSDPRRASRRCSNASTFRNRRSRENGSANSIASATEASSSGSEPPSEASLGPRPWPCSSTPRVCVGPCPNAAPSDAHTFAAGCAASLAAASRVRLSASSARKPGAASVSVSRSAHSSCSNRCAASAVIGNPESTSAATDSRHCHGGTGSPATRRARRRAWYHLPCTLRAQGTTTHWPSQRTDRDALGEGEPARDVLGAYHARHEPDLRPGQTARHERGEHATGGAAAARERAKLGIEPCPG